MPRPYAIHWDQVLRYLPPSLPMLYRVESDGLPAVDSLVQAGTGAEGKAIRQFQAHLLHAMIHRIHDLEGSLASCEADKGAMDKALSSTPVPQGTPTIDSDNPAIPLFRDVAQELLQYFGYKIDGKADLDVAAMLQSKTSVLFQALGAFMDPSSQGDSPETQKRLEQLKAELKKANTRATVYYTSWKSLERHVNHKDKVVPSDEMNLAAAVTSLVEKGYILDIQPNGNIPVETMCQMVAGIAEKLPPVGAVEAKDTPSVSQDGESKKMVPAADVSNYEELEQINASLDSQLRAAQKELSEAACWMDTAQQHAKNEAFYRDLLDQTAMALQNPDVYKSDDGSIQQEPIRLKIPELVAKLHAMGCENISLLAHQTVLLDKFRSGVRAITDPMEGQDEKLLEMLHRMKSRALYTGNGTHLQAQSTEMRNGVLYRITGLYYDGHDFEPVDFVNTLQADAQPEEPKTERIPNIVEACVADLLKQLSGPETLTPAFADYRLRLVHQGDINPNAPPVGDGHYHGFHSQVITVPRTIVPSVQKSGGVLAPSTYNVQTNTLVLLALWNGEHPSSWNHGAEFELRPQVVTVAPDPATPANA